MRNVQDATYTAFGASEKPHQAGALARLCDISGRDTKRRGFTEAYSIARMLSAPCELSYGSAWS